MTERKAKAKAAAKARATTGRRLFLPPFSQVRGMTEREAKAMTKAAAKARARAKDKSRFPGGMTERKAKGQP